jgi:hypothetical protein
MSPEGRLKQIIDSARAERRCSREALTVLSSNIDPYRLDTPAGHRDGAWVAEQLDRAIGPSRRIHWRGLHYAIVARGDVIKPNGGTYRNTDDDWHWLSDNAGKAARWLGYVDFQRIIDNRNSDPVIHRKPEVTPRCWLSIELDVTIPDVDDIIPIAGVSDFEGRQPYALAIFGEKASLEDVLSPIAGRFEADLYLPSGEISDTLLWRMARDGAADGRPMAVFVLADCDPAGHQMAISIGRKLQALRDLCFASLEFEVIPVALTVQQVRDLGLPSTPLKETEKRADRWREAFGIEQTEIDALATLRPRDLERIVEAAIEPYHDSSLTSRVWAAKRDWEEEAQDAIEQQIDGAALGSLRERAAGRLAELEAEVESINNQLRMAAEDIAELPKAIVPLAAIEEKADRQAPLISSAWSWTDATIALKARKAYDPPVGSTAA